MKVTQEEQNRLWIELLGTPPEERQPGDLTAIEISDNWKIDRNTVYKMVRDGELEKAKVYDETTGKSVFVYRPVTA